jgi:response regulator RpfG family c-di-GMP phosphodiesterase
MKLKKQHTIMIVDDEETIIKSLKRLLARAGHQCLSALSGAEALQYLMVADDPISLIISDQRMPNMTGSEFLHKAKGICPEAIRFLLTGYSDLDALVEAINKGEIHRYLTKPWNDDELLAQIGQALAQYELQDENRRLQEVIREQNEELKQFNEQLEMQVVQRSKAVIRQHEAYETKILDCFRLMGALMEMINPALGNYLTHAARLARKVAEAFGLDPQQVDQIEIAGLFHDVGLVGMPDSVLAKRKLQMEPEEYLLYTQHPLLVAATLEGTPWLAPVAEIILYHHAHVDGTGYPDGLTGEKIPLGARLLAPVSEYCRIIHTWPLDRPTILSLATERYGSDVADALTAETPQALLAETAQQALSRGAGNRFDMKVVEALERCIADDAADARKVRWLDVEALKTGMLLAKPLQLNDGRALLPAGIRLDDKLLDNLKKLRHHDRIGAQLCIR